MREISSLHIADVWQDENSVAGRGTGLSVAHAIINQIRTLSRRYYLFHLEQKRIA